MKKNNDEIYCAGEYLARRALCRTPFTRTFLTLLLACIVFISIPVTAYAADLPVTVMQYEDGNLEQAEAMSTADYTADLETLIERLTPDGYTFGVAAVHNSLDEAILYRVESVDTERGRYRLADNTEYLLREGDELRLYYFPASSVITLSDGEEIVVSTEPVCISGVTKISAGYKTYQPKTDTVYMMNTAYGLQVADNAEMSGGEYFAGHELEVVRAMQYEIEESDVPLAAAAARMPQMYLPVLLVVCAGLLLIGRMVRKR